MILLEGGGHMENNSNFKKIATLENEIEAGLLDSILSDRNIPHTICSYNDLVYDGIYQMVKGWGYVSSTDFYSQEILDILNDIRKSSNND